MNGHDIDIEVWFATRSVVVSVRGEIDDESAPILQAALAQLDSGRHVVVDLAAVTFLDFSAVSVLVAEAARMRRKRGSLCIGRASAAACRALWLSGGEGLLESSTSDAPRLPTSTVNTGSEEAVVERIAIWWSKLSDLQRLPIYTLGRQDPMPGWMVTSLTDAGIPGVVASCIEHDGITETCFRLPMAVADLIERRRRGVPDP